MFNDDSGLCYGVPGFLHILTVFSNRLSCHTKCACFILLLIHIILLNIFNYCINNVNFYFKCSLITIGTFRFAVNTSQIHC